MPFKNRCALTPRQAECMRLWALGYTAQQIGDKYGVSANTVHNYLFRVRLKYAERGRPVNTKDLMRARAIEDGLIGPHEWAPYLTGLPAMTITVIASDRTCGGCHATAQTLTRYNLDHRYVRPSEDPEAAAMALALGHQQAPVVIVQDDRANIVQDWSGYRPDLIRALASNGIEN